MRLEGDAAPLARAAMARAIESAVAAAAPELSSVELEGAPPPGDLVPLARLVGHG
jgi:hypothetical protein